MQILQPGARVGDLVRVRRQRWRVADVRAHEDCALLTLTRSRHDQPGRRAAVRRAIRRRGARPRAEAPAYRRRASVARAAAGAHRRRRQHRDAAHRVARRHRPAAPSTRAGARGDAGNGRPRAHRRRGRPGQDNPGGAHRRRAQGPVARPRASSSSPRRAFGSSGSTNSDERFGIDSTLLDAREVRQRLSRLAVGVNPWTTCPIVVTSADYIKRPEVLAAVAGCRWDAAHRRRGAQRSHRHGSPSGHVEPGRADAGTSCS